jgi:hypothetical protein
VHSPMGRAKVRKEKKNGMQEAVKAPSCLDRCLDS